MFDNIVEFGTQLFTAIVLLLSAGISAHMCYGFGSRKGREAFIGLILLLMVGTQFYHLIDAALYVPATRFYVYNVSMLILLLLWCLALIPLYPHTLIPAYPHTHPTRLCTNWC
jgi:hypothetical protein